MKIKTKLTVVFTAAALIGLLFAACSGGGADAGGGGATAPAITTTSLANGTVGVAYNATLAATSAKPITWSIETGSLPAGLTLAAATGVISGMPTTAGNSTFTVKAANSAESATKQLSITIAAAAAGSPVITTTSLEGGVLNTPYTATLEATGTAPITWSIEIDTLPAGLTLAAATGIISGTPTAAAVSTFTVKAANSAGSATKELSITITATAVAPAITTTTLPGGTVGTPYTADLEADGTGPITWSIETGDLPGGLALSSHTISGTPSAAGNFAFTVKAANSAGNDTKALSITITDTSVPSQTPTADDFDIGDLDQIEGDVDVIITPKSGKSQGAITKKYDGETTVPTAPGEYAVTFDVAAAGSYTAASGLSAGTLLIRNKFTTVDDIGTWLDTQGANTRTTLYKIALVTTKETLELSDPDDTSTLEAFYSGLNKGGTGTNKFVDLKITGMTALQSRAFRACTSIVNLIIGDTVGGKMEHVFVNCTNLAKLTLPNNPDFKEIAGNSFAIGGAENLYLTSITIPGSVERIVGLENSDDTGSGPFMNCTRLNRIEFLSGPMNTATTGNWPSVFGNANGKGIHKNAFYGVVTIGGHSVCTSIYGTPPVVGGGLPGVYVRNNNPTSNHFEKQ